MQIAESIFNTEFLPYISCFCFSESSLMLKFHWSDFFYSKEKSLKSHVETEVEKLKLREQLPVLIKKIRNYLICKLNAKKNILIESVPSYDSLFLSIDLNLISLKESKKTIKKHLSIFFYHIQNIDSHSELLTKVQKENIIIPTYYGKEVGWDITHICHARGIPIDTLIKEHTQKIYTVCAVGFSPGFAYLGFVTQKITSPRKNQPRSYVPKGAVGIANEQTGIYPSDSPGGWNIIGRTYQTMINYKNPDNPNFLSVGDRVQFQSISKEVYLAKGGQLSNESGDML